MIGRTIRRLAGMTTWAVLLFMLPSSAQAGVPSLINVQMTQAAMLFLSSAGPCLAFAYDRNGNRISQTVKPLSSGATVWGTGTFGCFVWAQ